MIRTHLVEFLAELIALRLGFIRFIHRLVITGSLHAVEGLPSCIAAA